MTRRYSLRLRLTATFVALGAILMTGGYAGTAWLLHRAVWGPLDAALYEEAGELAPTVAAQDAAADLRDGVSATGRNQLSAIVARMGSEVDLGPDKFITVWSPSGRILAYSGHLPPQAEPGASNSGRSAARFVRDGPSLYRVITRVIDGTGSITIGVRADRQNRALRRAHLALVAGALGLLVGIGLLAWALTHRATREIDALTSELEGLEAASIGRRLSPRDTTEVARLTEALNRLLARLEVAVNGLRRFTADAAHELRTPLAALRAHLDVALARPPSIDAYRDGLLDASEQTERLAVLAEDLLTLSAIESTTLTDARAVDMAPLASEVAEFLDAVAQEQNRRFSVHVDANVAVLGEALLLKRLLLNLLGNAFKHTAPGVAVELRIRRHDAAIVITVRDDGAGIDPTQRERLFERFAPERHGASGAGLGLAICREIVTRHHGTIEVESKVGSGTTVTVRLPSFEA